MKISLDPACPVNELWEMSPLMVASAPLAWTLVLKRSFPMPAASIELDILVGRIKANPKASVEGLSSNIPSGFWPSHLLSGMTTIISVTAG